jgi:hypothetical protein
VSGLDNLAAGGDGGIRTLETPFEVCSFSKRVPSASRPRLPSDGLFAADALAKRCICPTPKGLASILAMTWFDEPILFSCYFSPISHLPELEQPCVLVPSKRLPDSAAPIRLV